ncbi:MAG: NAD-dependent epimerase/dehydratase family protein [Anaerolineae bacterium]
MRVLIIGGTGLISTAIADALSARGEELTLYNRGQSGTAALPHVRTIHGDRTDYPAFERQMAELPPFDCVVDMVGYRPEDGASAVRAFRGRVGQFVFTSTVDVYQKPASRYPYVETEPYGGLNEYSHNKVLIEQTLRAAAAESGFPLTIIRCAYTYGEGRGPVHAFESSSYLDRLRRGKPIVVHGDGTSLWTCCHRDDVAAAFLGAIGNAHTIGQVYHVAGEDWMTWNQYHQRAAAAIGAPPPHLVHIPSDLLAEATAGRISICRENFQFCNIFDTSRAREHLGFRYTVPWEEGVRRMAAWLERRGLTEGSNAETYEDRVVAAWRRLGQRMAAELQSAT